MPKSIRKPIFQWSRWLHIYVSSGLFSLLVFFCMTGVLLNHLDWIAGGKKDAQHANQLTPFTPLEPEQVSTPFHWLASVNTYYQSTYRLSKPRSIEWDEDFSEVVMDYPLPAGYALITLNYQTGEYLIDYQKGTFWQVLGDLHKGRHSGKAWAWVIDISAVLMLLFAITGLTILWQNRSKRQAGTWCVIAGTLTPVVIYLLWVPRLSGL